VTSTFLVRVLKEDANVERIRELLVQLAEHFNPQHWQKHGPESFKKSEARTKNKGSVRYSDTVRAFPEAQVSWNGRLHEAFEWSWNDQSTMTIENILGIDYYVGQPSNEDLENPDRHKKVIDVRYHLLQSMNSKLWLSRQAGGLDIDRGECTVQLQGFKERQNPQKHRLTSPHQISRQDVSSSEFVDSDWYNICVRANKTVRFTPVEEGPEWLSTLLNYLTPVMAQIWLNRAVHTGIWNAIDAAEREKTRPPELPPLNQSELPPRRTPWHN
jgi:hypothetical protein